MSFIKLDRGIVNSSVWYDRDIRDVFLTALLMATLHEVTEELPQLDVRTMKPTGWNVPVGWYGLVEAAGVGIVRLSGVELEAGLSALTRMGEAELESRADAFDGRRLVRVDGGYIALNFARYLEKDHGSAERQRRYRERKKRLQAASLNAQIALERQDQTELRRLTRQAMRDMGDEK